MVWVRRGVRIFGVLIVLSLVIVYGGTELMFDRQVSVDLPPIVAATDPADIAEGARMARFLGCLSCHGPKARGQALVDDFAIGRIVAPALSRVAQDGIDGQIARAIRNGVGTDARALYVMPTEALGQLSDQDLSRLIGWMRSLQPSLEDLIGKKQVGPLGRIGVLTGRFPSSLRLEGGQPHNRPADVGRYLAQVSCGQCHAVDHARPAGTGDVTAPALAPIVAAYDPSALRTLLRTGKAVGDRTLPLMSDAAREGLWALSDMEIAAIQTWLTAQARAMPPG